MQCPRCGAILLKSSVYCHSCGIPLAEAAPSLPVTPQSGVNEAPAPEVPPPAMSERPYLESDWPEYSEAQAPVGMPSDPWAAYPPPSPVPGVSVSSSNYPPPPVHGPLPPSFMPPATPASKRRGPLLAVTLILAAIVLLLVFGSVFVGIRIGQSHSASAPARVIPITSPTADSNQLLYQRVTSQNPSFVDSLQDATLSTWSVFEKPTYGCELKSDGLHVHIKDTDHFGYCTSGRGIFKNFAFQVEMKIMSGSAGGVTFRGDTQAGNLYHFRVSSEGRYLINTEQNHKEGPNLAAGTISSFSAGFGQKNTLTVIAQGSQIYFYSNQKFLTRIQDSTYASGYLGVAASDSTAPAEVVYINAQIWIL